jgi:hypothetical protein
VEILKSTSGRNRRRKVEPNDNPGTAPPPILSVAIAMENFTKVIEVVVHENIKTVKLLDVCFPSLNLFLPPSPFLRLRILSLPMSPVIQL